jgi:hypothetical protein
MKSQIICKIDKHNLRSCGEETVVLKYLPLKVVDYDGMEQCEGYDPPHHA